MLLLLLQSRSRRRSLSITIAEALKQCLKCRPGTADDGDWKLNHGPEVCPERVPGEVVLACWRKEVAVAPIHAHDGCDGGDQTDGEEEPEGGFLSAGELDVPDHGGGKEGDDDV